jgi:hypothetical protein
MDDNEMSEIDSGADWRPIERLLYAYTWIVDQRKWELMDSVFAPDATIDYTRTGGQKGPYRPTLESPGAASVPPTRRFLLFKGVFIDCRSLSRLAQAWYVSLASGATPDWRRLP